MRQRSKAFILPVFLLAVTTAKSAQTSDVDIGGIVITVSDSWTAQVFHIVDQLSEWDEFCHRQYGRWATRTHLLDEQDRKLLQRHAQLRHVRGWGKGFEQAFYVESSIEVAAQNAVETKLLSAEEAATEKAILLHFAPKLSDLLNKGAPQINSFKERLVVEGKQIVPFVQKLVRFSETEKTVRVPLFLVTNPEENNGGGGFSGGRLVLEIEDKPDPLPTLFHECSHTLLFRHKEAIEVAAKSVGLKWMTLNEGIAYALAPGLTDNKEEFDSLSESLVRTVLKGTPAADSFVQFYMVAVVIRPLLRGAIETGETITTFLPKAVDKWQKCCATLNRSKAK